MEPARTGLRQIMQDLLRTQPTEEAVVLAWPLVCGKEVASRTHAVSFADGVLTLTVADASWRNQLQSFASRYITAYEELLGKAVKNVKFVVQGSGASLQHSAKPVSAESVKKNGSPGKSRRNG